MYQTFEQWFQELPDATISNLATREFKGAANALTPEEQRANLKEVTTTIYRKTLSYRDKRLKLEGKITRYYFDGSEAIENEKPIWRELVEL
jgi:hypothetical protein